MSVIKRQADCRIDGYWKKSWYDFKDADYDEDFTDVHAGVVIAADGGNFTGLGKAG
jgi:hypothetical protein